MSDEAFKSYTRSKNMNRFSLAVCCFAALVCELEFISGVTSAGRVYKLIHVMFVPVLVLFPLLIAFSGQAQINKLKSSGDINESASAFLKAFLSSAMLLVSLGMMQLLEIGFVDK